MPLTELSRQRQQRFDAARRHTLSLLPALASRIDIHGEGFDAEMDTLEALAQRAPLVTNAQFSDAGWKTQVDILHLSEEGYIPIVISAHRAARPDPRRSCQTLPTRKLGQAQCWSEEKYRLRHHTVDSYRLALATRALAGMGLASRWGGVIGQDPERVFLHHTDIHQAALSAALAAPLPTRPRRVKECDWCSYQQMCRSQLRDMDDISLVLPGDRAESFRRRGINTVTGLINANLGEASALAAAWKAKIPVLRRHPSRPIRRAALEVDIDVETYLDHGAYLWGMFDGHRYHPYATWKPLGGDPEAENFAAFWAHLKKLRTDNPDFCAYCYANNGENHWLRTSAKRFAGKPGIPGLEEIEEFIHSEQWVDVFQVVKTQLIGPEGLGLKTVAKAAGYQWEEAELEGEGSVAAYREARTLMSWRDRLLSYNEDDCRATAAVRDWLSHGTPGLPALGFFSDGGERGNRDQPTS
ncbi:TM0106 family RecB-like putative nuclease [Corynebacterium poyangense]|uniref:TM0106 family RecB-like putative nuclease n=1 Tax=Corynebacterium poyangense TaxID=2684405 RepID=A0A7H0SRT4_9CORY|nr:TM0106 family RecB-like putative nuclease [Corynebacterium poyangense]QNQ91259.1 TM0106 family RecB-like putative nuclease [Corynebacterium poyangense]